MRTRQPILYLLGTCALFLLIFPLHSGFAAESKLLKLVPEDAVIPEWVRDDEPYLATDEASLAEWINGAAPFYIQHGAVEVVFQDYVKEDIYLSLEIYHMDSEEHAKLLYADIDSENPEHLKKIGTEGRFVSGLVGAYLVEYWQKSFFVRLTITEKSTQSKETIVKFAKTVSEKIDEL